METLKGGREVFIKFEDEAKEGQTVLVQKLRLKDYDRADKALEAGDEFGMVAVVIGKDKAFVESLDPVSYELVQAAAQEVNSEGFFVYAARRQRDREERSIRRLNAMSPAILKTAAEAGAKALSATPPGLQPR